MKIISSGPKYYLGRLGKKLITSMGLKTIGRSKKNIKARYVIANVSIKNFQRLSRSLKICLIRVMQGRGPTMNPQTVNFI